MCPTINCIYWKDLDQEISAKRNGPEHKIAAKTGHGPTQLQLNLDWFQHIAESFRIDLYGISGIVSVKDFGPLLRSVHKSKYAICRYISARIV